MDITVVSTGKTFYGVDPLLGGILLEAFPAAFERAGNPYQPAPGAFVKPIPQFAVIKHAMSGEYFVQCKILGRTELVGGSPEIVEEAFKKMGYMVPDAILAEFREALKRPTDEQKAARDRAAFERSFTADHTKHTVR
jgi:hypothetical protein